MEEMIVRWIRETLLEEERARKNQNFFKINEMRKLVKALRQMRDKLLNSGN
jgi:hypothetical protein